MRTLMPRAEWEFGDVGSNENSALTVETVATHIYFYAPVNQDRCLDLIKQIKKLDENLRNERISRALPDDYPKIPIWLHIFSPGGDLFAGLAVSDQIKQIETPVYSIVEGYGASAATLISMSCAKRYIQPSAYMLIHQYSSMAWGTHEQLEDERVLGRMLMDRLVYFYANHSDVSEDEAREILRRDSWFNAEQSIERGFVDNVYT